MGLDIFIMNKPELPSLDKLERCEQRNLEISILFPEWEALFYDELNVPLPKPYISGENISDYEDYKKQQFHSALTRFPMLASIDDYYADFFFNRDEIRELLDECISLVANIKHPQAYNFLNKLIVACREAIKINSGLFLICD